MSPLNNIHNPVEIEQGSRYSAMVIGRVLDHEHSSLSQGKQGTVHF